MPRLVDPRAALEQEAGNVPAAVTDRVVQRRADRAGGRFDVGAGIDQDAGHGLVVAARGPVERRLTAPVLATHVNLGPGVDQQVHDAWSVGEEARPVRRDVQRRATPGETAEP